MAVTIISLKNVSKEYRKIIALKDIHLILEKGKIYGLVGKNGAGKTTIMRIIAGLVFPTTGEVIVNTLKMGTLIETPSLNMDMSAKQNLKFYRILFAEQHKENNRKYGKSSNDKEQMPDDKILAMVGLENTGKQKVKNFSLGMRQRLGIAIALLANPDFVMLDEPVNGLDPVGVVEIRNLIQKLKEENGMTFLISSHNLPELYKTATDFIIIDKGIVKKEITHGDLKREAGGNLEEYFLSVIK
ncbi:MAG: ATP-binding cassette domain-containing protein [Eubacterium sp.]|nr:ATP-binding cassette domain-containing protein [Eubacterium sp.]